ncbi:MAG: DUF58 domain-containing protein [Atribacterota bacterium]|nr:DUF58 domain-containing protein [Atribacterota bacterium]MDD5637119.1 DUF58 domain-containing protein [Atribacterota bacterium]
MNNVNYDRPLTSIFTDGFFRFLLLILLFIALLLVQKNLILISILLLTMFYACKLWSYVSIKNIHYSFDAETKKGFPGEIISLQAQIYNNKILPIWIKLLIPMDKRLIPEIKMKNNFLCEEFSLLWYDHFLWNWNLTAKQRGCFQIGPPFLETGDLLGFFQKRRYLSQSAVEVIIYPRPISLNFLSTPIKEFFGKTGIDSPVKDPVYPIATHDYQHGEPAKYIHWKASARYNHLQSKIFDSSTQRKTLLVVDVSSFREKRQEELFEKILEVVAAMVLEFDKQGSPYSIFSNGKVTGSNMTTNFSFGTGPEQVSRAMELLARLTIEEFCSMDEILFKEMKIPAGTGCIYCAYRMNKKNTQISQFLIKHNTPVYLLLAKSSYHKKFSPIPALLFSEIYGEAIDLARSDSQYINNYL